MAKFNARTITECVTVEAGRMEIEGAVIKLTGENGEVVAIFPLHAVISAIKED